MNSLSRKFSTTLLGGAIGGLCIGILIDRFGLKVLVAVFSLFRNVHHHRF
jgi:hypothetical protein